MTSLKEKLDKKVIVLDASAFVAGFDPFSINEEQYTAPLIKEEVMRNSLLRIRFKTATDSGKLKVKAPEKVFLDNARAAASSLGDEFFLSEADLQVLALALELKTEGYTTLIASDDYSIQNVANHMGIEFASLATFGIRFRLRWVRYCPACHRKYGAEYKYRKCKICGTELKRKPLGKKILKH